jgi:hypothetical protein
MHWEFIFREEEKYLEVSIHGHLTNDGLNKLAVERWAELRRRDCRKVLFDFRDTENTLDTFAIYQRPDESEKHGVLKINCTAAVVPEKFLIEFKFMETVYRNRGYDLSVFIKEEDAIGHLGRAG